MDVKKMMYVKMPKYEADVLEKLGIKYRKTKGTFINSSGYLTIKTSRKNVPALSDKIVCVHTLFAWLKQRYVDTDEPLNYRIRKNRELYKTFKLETHHNNGNKLDNRMENLTGFLTRTEHNKLNYELTKRGG